MSSPADPPPILIVEDEPLIRDLIEAALEEGGYGVILAQSGADAVKRLEDSARKFSAMVTDIDLGAGPSGWDVARVARRLRPGLPIIYMSGASADGWSADGGARERHGVQAVRAGATCHHSGDPDHGRDNRCRRPAERTPGLKA